MTFFEAARREGLIYKYFGITDLERRTLQFLSQGQSLKQIAARDDVNQEAVQRRVERTKAKLLSRNRDEMIYKSFVYGAVPFAT